MGGGSTENPYDILRFGPVDDRGARSGRHGEGFEEKYGVIIAFAVQRHRTVAPIVLELSERYA